MSNKPAPRRAQEPSDNISQNPNAVEVGNGATRYDWSIAFNRICMREKYPAIAIAVAMRLVEFLARGTGQCNPGRDTMANELGRSVRQIDRAYEFLETHGWIGRKRGGPHDPVTFTLLIPPDDADIHHFGAKKIDALQDTAMSRKNDLVTGHKTRSYGTQNGVLRDTQYVPSKEQVEQIEQSAAPPRAPEYADRESEAFQDLLEVRPLKDPSQEPAARAVYGALRKTTCIKDILDKACSFEKLPEDCVGFLAYLASNKPITAASS